MHVFCPWCTTTLSSTLLAWKGKNSVQLEITFDWLVLSNLRPSPFYIFSFLQASHPSFKWQPSYVDYLMQDITSQYIVQFDVSICCSFKFLKLIFQGNFQFFIQFGLVHGICTLRIVYICMCVYGKWQFLVFNNMAGLRMLILLLAHVW